MNHDPYASKIAARADLLDPSSLMNLGGVELVARSVVEGFLMDCTDHRTGAFPPNSPS